jgi:hypothetical protein
MTDVTATASGGFDAIGLHLGASGKTLTDVTATASGGNFSRGLLELGSDTTITNLTAAASAGGTNHGMSILGGTDVAVRHSKMSGTNAALFQSSGSSNNSVALSQIVGPLQSQTTLQCFNNYDASMAAVTCPQ